MKIGRKRIYPSHVLIYILLSLWALTTVFPFLWVLISSFKNKDIIQTDAFSPVSYTHLEKVSYLDGCKVYFENGGWIIARFSGTEPLIRIFCEMEDGSQANAICDQMKSFLGL